MTPDQRLLANAIGWLLAVAALAAGGAWAGYAWRDRGARADLAECQRVHAEALAITLRAAQQAEAEHRAIEAKTQALQTEALNAAHSETQAARADADRVRVALDRLRRQLAAAPRGGEPAADPAAAGASAPAGAPGDLPVDLLWRLGQAAGELAAAADDARTAGLACQRSYDALTTPRLGGGDG